MKDECSVSGQLVCARAARAEVCGDKIGGANINTRNYPARQRAVAMSLYYEAAAILANTDNTGGSLVSRIYTKKDLKSSPGQIFALIAEASKWSVVLKDVIEKCGILAEERKVRKN
jgi:hypothetical protein